MAGEGRQLPTGSRIEQDLTAYEDLSDAELEKIMAGKMPDPGEQVEEEEEEEPEEDPVEEPEADEGDDEDDEDGEEEDADGEEKPEEGEEKPEGEEEKPNPLEDRIKKLERRLKIEALERQKETAARERAELLASKNAGKAGFLKQQLDKSGKAPAKSQAKAKDGDDEAQWDAEVDPQAQQDAEQPNEREMLWDEDRKELIKIAVNDEGLAFARERADEIENMPDSFNARLQELVSESAVPYREVFATSSIKTVRKLARSLFSTAYATALIEHADKTTAEATTRKAESVAKSKRRKKKAAISKSGRRAKAKAKPQSYEDMTDEELEAAFQAEYGENYRARRDSLIG